MVSIESNRFHRHKFMNVVKIKSESEVYISQYLLMDEQTSFSASSNFQCICCDPPLQDIFICRIDKLLLAAAHSTLHNLQSYIISASAITDNFSKILNQLSQAVSRLKLCTSMNWRCCFRVCNSS